jgi:Arc/MetJ-type ribon-helix-helix transcriptional regulator
MKNPIRITVALDSETNSLIEKIKEETKISQSELVREALRFYYDNRKIDNVDVKQKLDFYIDMLLSGEHVILDVDHWLLFLSLVESSPEKEQFWEKCREVARSHAEQLGHKVCSLEDLLERLEACNFFRITKNSENDYTLVLGSEIIKKFVKTFIEEFLSVMGLKAEIKENITKIRITTESKF